MISRFFSIFFFFIAVSVADEDDPAIIGEGVARVPEVSFGI